MLVGELVAEDELRVDEIEDTQLLALNVALQRLEEMAPQFRALLDMRYFAGLSIREIADTRGTCTRTVEREWQKARAFLHVLMD